MDSWLQLLPECEGNTLLIEMLGYKNPNHTSNIGQVAKKLQDNFTNRTAIGIIDKDKSSIPSYFRAFDLIDSFDYLEFKKHPEKSHYIIMLIPAFEDFILQVADDIDVSIKNYKFNTEKYFREQCKKQNTRSNQNLKNFLNTINQKRAPSTEKIKAWISEILPPD